MVFCAGWVFGFGRMRWAFWVGVLVVLCWGVGLGLGLGCVGGFGQGVVLVCCECVLACWVWVLLLCVLWAFAVRWIGWCLWVGLWVLVLGWCFGCLGWCLVVLGLECWAGAWVALGVMGWGVGFVFCMF